MIFHSILLECCNRIQMERTASSIYHLLRGRRSIQTVQDAHLFQLERYFGIYKSLTRQHFNQTMNELQLKGLLHRIDTEQTFYQTTRETSKWIATNKQVSFPFTSYEGLAYHEITDVFLDRLVLLIQTLTNSKMDYFSFIPVIDKPLIVGWVKSVYRRLKGEEAKFLAIIFQELRKILHHFSKVEAGIFVDRLTGYQSYGMSIDQLSAKYGQSVDDIQLIIINLVHRLLSTLYHEKDNYPFLTFIINDLTSTTRLSNSAFQTYQHLQQGVTIENIARNRNLKINTIHDHLIEIALYETNFPLHHYVNPAEQQEILNAVKQTSSSKLRDIKQQVNDSISYFQIRLVLALQHKQLK
ncbi:hypothetical protein CWR48_08585 [Oceanobacillus arenosus]|uniref:Helicase Helix-turn-helix domain-containing protein n=1 Tax=Oceanobacillus arenosus TaxID=1229153 RepID=A0A3D8PSJ5_9BACI|nr:helix-turn-helix domain-containing protein [Oceanobacillus arenosus]RDW19096.1 hypothetical protein CWR48_08585 [Oceanobacillus arenosus]